ncbi:MAG TPA: transposase, partial [Desulfobacteria bacterium]|nr:transposase [Desulfobacteria bacterium]
FCDKCNFIEFKGVIAKVRQRVLHLLNNPEKMVPGKEIRIKIPCPSSNFPEDMEPPKVEVLSLFLKEADSDRPSVFNGIFELEEKLNEARLDLMVKRGIITGAVMRDSISSESFFFKCPKLPADMEARIGVRRDPQNPNRKQKIFGFNAVIDTSVEMGLGLELPVACSTLAGNAHEGKHYIINREQILEHHGKTSKIDLADAKYDEHDNFAFSRSNGAIPIIDYNPRSEKVTAAALKERGYDRNGWPYAPCGVLTRPNGFDFDCQRASFSCRRQCVTSKDQKIAEYTDHCPHWINSHGFTKHMSIHEFPRLITEVIRGTDRHQKLKNLRSASERTNATAKEDFAILSKPKIRGLEHAGILSQIAVIVVLLKRVASFIVKVTLALRKKIQDNKSPPKFFVPGPSVPKFILNLVMRE